VVSDSTLQHGLKESGWF